MRTKTVPRFHPSPTVKMASYLTMAVCVVTTITAGASVTIAENGKAKAAIVVASDSMPAEQHAARELAQFLRQVTGAVFSITHTSGTSRTCIFVGAKAARLGDPAFTTDGLGDEGIVVRTVGNDLILAGGELRGTLYSVYTFLEDYVGCHWWTATESTIPSRPTLVIEDTDIRYVPRIEYRDTDSPEAADADYSVRNKYNGHDHRLFIDDGFHNVRQDADRGGRKYAYARSDKWQSHGMWTLVPPELYFEAHPEWYSLIDGKRTCELYRSSLCLTNEQMRQQMVNNALLVLNWNPQATMLSVEQMDDGGGGEPYCHCPDCLADLREEGSPAGGMVRFVNAVAEDIEKKFPNAIVTTLAYHYTRKPPRLARPRGNVVVRLCDIECSFAVPLSHERNKAFQDDVVGWSKICNRLYIWDYVSNFGYPLLPHPNLRALGPNVKFLADHNVRGMFAEAVTTRGTEMVELRNWVLAKLYWNPDLDGDKLIDEFISGYYGPASSSVLAYVDTLHDAVDISGDYLGLGSPPSSGFLSFNTLSLALKHIQAAELAASHDRIIRSRVHGVKVCALYAFLMRWDSLRDEAAGAGAKWPLSNSISEVYREFADIVRERGIDLTGVPMTPEMLNCRSAATSETKP